jgi:hypothetical protein
VHTCNEHQTPAKVGVLYWSLKMRVKFRLVERRSPKPNEAGSMPATLASSCEAHADEQASDHPTDEDLSLGAPEYGRKVVSSNLTAATKIWRYSCYRYVARAL